MCRRSFKCSFLHGSRSLLLDNGASTFWISTSAFSSWLPICSSEGPSVRPRRGRPQSDDLQKQLWIHFSHLHSRLKAIFQTADSSSRQIFFPIFLSFFFPSFCVRHFLRKEEFHCKFFFEKTNQHAVNRLSFIFAERIRRPQVEHLH